MKNTITTIKNCSEKDCLAIATYFYKLCVGTDGYRAHEECQVLLNALVKKFNLENHYRSVLDAFIRLSVKQKKLRQKEVSRDYENPFDFTGKLPVSYREDSDIYDRCGNFSTDSLLDIDLSRCVFSGNEENFAKIVGCTFFHKPVEPGKTFRIPGEIKISAAAKKAAEDYSDVRFIKDALKLSDEEAELLMVSFRLNSVRELYEVVNDFCRDDDMDRFGIFEKVLGKPKKEIRKMLRGEEKLYAYGFLSDEGEFERDAMSCIECQDLNVYFSDIIKEDKSKDAYELDSFSVKSEKTELVSRLLTNSTPSNILLFGAPGAGKTEYAKSLARACGLTPLVYKNELEVKNSDGDEKSALFRLNCLLSVKQENSVIIVDEAESVLKTLGSFLGFKFSLPQKGTVNKMLENSENKVIYILNYTDELDESTLRRFTYSLRFGEMPKHMLRSIADSKLSKIKMPEQLKNEILDLCGKYHVTGSSVDNMVKTVKGMDCNDENQVLKDVKSVLEANSALIFGKAKMREIVNDSYDLSVLNTSTPADEMVEMVQSAVEYAEENRSSLNGSENGAIRMLFYGLSGTGKTELVRYMAEKMGKKIVLKRASDIMGKYVGENEKNIKAAFEEAEANDSILLFDEADSFFADRNSAKTSWERTMVNEFLTQMEEFNGILICTTNLRKIMDPALQRRFHIITEFKALREEGIKKLLSSFFGAYEFEEKEIAELLTYDTVTPGDFGALAGRMRFVPKSKLCSRYIVDELCQIQKEKSGVKSIGFGA